MTDFKEGDRVKCVRTGNYKFTHNRIYEVLYVSHMGSRQHVCIRDNEGTKKNPFSSRFILAEDPLPKELFEL